MNEVCTPVFVVYGDYYPGQAAMPHMIETPDGKIFVVEEVLATLDLSHDVESYVCRINGRVETLHRRGGAWMAIGGFAQEKTG